MGQLDMQRLARMAETDNWLHDPVRRRRCRRHWAARWLTFACLVLALALAVTGLQWRQ